MQERETRLGFRSRARAWCARPSSWIPAILAVWAVLLVLAFRPFVVYTFTPGPAAVPPATWPGESRFHPEPATPTLLVFSHPECPCTRATLAGVEQALARSPRGIRTVVFFVGSPGGPASRVGQGLIRTAQSLPGARLVRDIDGREAGLFHVFTSGQVLYYDAAGMLQFSGGITAARGHQGDNPGLSDLESVMEGRPGGPNCLRAPVYGCLIGGTP